MISLILNHYIIYYQRWSSLSEYVERVWLLTQTSKLDKLATMYYFSHVQLQSNSVKLLIKQLEKKLCDWKGVKFLFLYLCELS